MNGEEIKIKCTTEGFDQAMYQVEELANAYDGFPAQVQIKNCHDCTINIYPTQIKMIEYGTEEERRTNERL